MTWGYFTQRRKDWTRGTRMAQRRSLILNGWSNVRHGVVGISENFRRLGLPLYSNLTIRLGFVRSHVIALASREHEGPAPAPACRDLTIDLRPESDEIIYCRDDRHRDHEPDCNVGNQIDWKDELTEIPFRPLMVQDCGDNAHNLSKHLQFAKIARLNRKPFRSGNAT